MPVKPEEVGLSSTQLERIATHLKTRYIEPEKITGCLTLIARKGQIAYLEPLGQMDRERGKTMQTDTIFRIYSMTKPITSVALMMLYEEGRFQLSDPIWKFIPEWRNLRVYAAGNHPDFVTTRPKRHMTISDLFTHTSGLTYGFMERTNVDAAYRKLGVGDHNSSKTLKDMIDILGTLPLEFSPGEYWNYSNATDVLGYLIEVISGMSLDEFFKTRILDPLGMEDTGFHVPVEKHDRFAANYQRTPSKKLILADDPVEGIFSKPRSYLSGGGGLVSTANDYFRFCQMMLNGGDLEGVRILGKRTVDYMTMNHLPGGTDMASLSVSTFEQVATEGSGFGLGFSIILSPISAGVISSTGEYSWGGMASTAFWIDPVEEMIVIFLTQFMPSATFNFRGQLKSIIYPAIQ